MARGGQRSVVVSGLIVFDAMEEEMFWCLVGSAAVASSGWYFLASSGLSRKVTVEVSVSGPELDDSTGVEFSKGFNCSV